MLSEVECRVAVESLHARRICRMYTASGNGLWSGSGGLKQRFLCREQACVHRACCVDAWWACCSVNPLNAAVVESSRQASQSFTMCQLSGSGRYPTTLSRHVVVTTPAVRQPRYNTTIDVNTAATSVGAVAMSDVSLVTVTPQ